MSKHYSEEFKTQIVKLYNNGKSVGDLNKEYQIQRGTIYAWIKAYNNTGSFHARDNRTLEEEKILRLEKELKFAKMEVDILKQAALIMGRKQK